MSRDATWQLVLPTGQQVPLGRSELRLGREEGSCDVLLPSAKVSRVHATVWVDEQGQAWVRDLNSANGTAVDGRRVVMEPSVDGTAHLFGLDLPPDRVEAAMIEPWAIVSISGRTNSSAS